MLRLAVAACLLVLAAGCTDPEPKEPEPSTSATPTVAAPSMPAQAKENTPEGAAAFVDYYIRVLNHAASTGDVTKLSDLSDPECSGCQKYIDLYRNTYANGGSFDGGAWSAGPMNLTFEASETFVTTTVEVSSSAYRSKDGQSSSEAASTTKVSFGITGDPWVVTQLGLGDPR